MMRVFHDRLISHEDRTWFCGELLSASADAFGPQGLEAFTSRPSSAPSFHASKPSTPRPEPSAVPDDLAVPQGNVLEVAQTKLPEEGNESAQSIDESERDEDEPAQSTDDVACKSDGPAENKDGSAVEEDKSARVSEGEVDTHPAQSPRGPGAGQDREPGGDTGPTSPPGTVGTGDGTAPDAATSAPVGDVEARRSGDGTASVGPSPGPAGTSGLGFREGSVETSTGAAGRNGSPGPLNQNRGLGGGGDRQGGNGGSEVSVPVETVSPLQQLGRIRFCSFLGQVRPVLHQSCGMTKPHPFPVPSLGCVSFGCPAPSPAWHLRNSP